MNIKNYIILSLIVILIINICIGCIHPQQNNNQSNNSNDLNTSYNRDGYSVSNISENNVENEHVNISSIDYSAIHVLPSYNDTTSEWLKTNASFVAKIALNDSRAQEVLMSGGKILGVIYFCHPTPSNYSGPACAPALMIQSGTNIYSFSVNESEKKVVYMGIGIDQDVRSVETFIKDLKDENPSARSSAAEGLI
jgi:hypothetical protein